jgi:hypothetical protein
MVVRTQNLLLDVLKNVFAEVDEEMLEMFRKAMRTHFLHYEHSKSDCNEFAYVMF